MASVTGQELRDQIEAWRRKADLDARAGAPVGTALNEALDALQQAQARLDAQAAEIAHQRELAAAAMDGWSSEKAKREQADADIGRLTKVEAEWRENTRLYAAASEDWRKRAESAGAERDQLREAQQRVRDELDGILREAKQALSEAHPAGTARSRADGMARAAHRALAALDQAPAEEANEA